MITVPDIRQAHDYDCAAAVVSAVLLSFGWDVGAAEVAEAMGTNPLDGTDPRAVEAYLRMQGLGVLSGHLNVEDLRYFGRQGRPVLCLVNRDGIGHYVVSLGVNRGGVHLHDPIDGPIRLRLPAFEAAWSDWDRLGGVYRNFGIVVSPA